MADTLNPYVPIASQHLPSDIAQRWLGLGRPAVRLVTEGNEGVVARLGGLPVLPDDVAWPEWEGHGPLSFIAEIDLAALAANGLRTSLDLPTTGRLLAFYFDGSVDGGEATVGSWDPETAAGARIIHVEAGRDAGTERPAPEGVHVYPEQLLQGEQVTTYPNWENPAVEAEFGHDENWDDHPVLGDAFREALDEVDQSGPKHQIGGWADPVQGPVELEVLEFRGIELEGDEQAQEARQWHVLLQVDTDSAAGMMWGDMGVLYWMACSTSESAAGMGTARGQDAELGETAFTWQCG